MMEWSDAIATGIESIDEQHRELFRRVNRFAEAVNTKQEKQVLLETLNFLRLYATYHFDDEEKVMESIGYPRLAEHKREHALFADKVFDLRLEATLDEQDVASQTLDFLTGWLAEHIAKADRDIGTYQEQVALSR